MELEPYDPDEAVEAYISTANTVIENLYVEGIITIDQVEAGRDFIKKWAKDNLGMVQILNDGDIG